MNAAQKRRQIQAATDFVRSRIITLENQYARALVPQYKRAYDELQAKLTKVWNQYVQGETWDAKDTQFRARTEYLMDQIADEMERLQRQVHDSLIDAQVQSFRATYYGQAWVTNITGNGLAVNMPVLPTEAVRAAVLFPYENGTQFFRLEQNRLEFINKVRGAVIQSQVQGETIYQAQKRLAAELGLPIGRRTLEDRQANAGNFYRTEMIARTEILRSSNLGAHAIYDANADVVKGWRYSATLDDRTCPICSPLDGKEYALDETANIPPKHPNCRCSDVPVLLDAVDLGDGATRAGQFGPEDANMTYAQWAQKYGIDGSADGGLRELRPGVAAKSPGAKPVRVRRR